MLSSYRALGIVSCGDSSVVTFSTLGATAARTSHAELLGDRVNHTPPSAEATPEQNRTAFARSGAPPADITAPRGGA